MLDTDCVVKLLHTPGRDYFSMTPRLVAHSGTPSLSAPVALTSSPVFSAGPRGARVAAAAAGDQDVRPSSPETAMAEIRSRVQISGAPHRKLAVRSKTGQIVKAAATATAEELYTFIHQHNAANRLNIFALKIRKKSYKLL